MSRKLNFRIGSADHLHRYTGVKYLDEMCSEIDVGHSEV